jgi:hypothetical protein
MNPLETQLRSWTPRRPAARLERKLFRRRRESAPRPESLLAWLVPVTVCLVFACVTLNQPIANPLSAVPGTGTLVAMSLSNQSYAAYLPGSFQQTANRWDTFEWTNGSRSSSSMHSLTPPKAND